MEPISAAMGVIGLGMQIFSGFNAAATSKQMAAVSSDEAAQEQHINDLKQQQMEMDARRQSTEQIRKAQQLSALSLDRATNQGAQKGTGVIGGMAGIFDQANVNLGGINNALTIGRGINQYNKNISADKMQMASLGGQAATDQGIATLGGAIMKAGPITGSLGKDAFSGLSSSLSLFNPGTLSGGLGKT